VRKRNTSTVVILSTLLALSLIFSTFSQIFLMTASAQSISSKIPIQHSSPFSSGSSHPPSLFQTYTNHTVNPVIKSQLQSQTPRQQIQQLIAPIANAGRDQTVYQGSIVALDGTASYDPSGYKISNYKWIQIAGVPVTLVVGENRGNGIGPAGGTITTAALAKPLFIAPTISGVLTFGLTVTESRGVNSVNPSIVHVFVVPRNTYSGGPVSNGVINSNTNGLSYPSIISKTSPPLSPQTHPEQLLSQNLQPQQNQNILLNSNANNTKFSLPITTKANTSTTLTTPVPKQPNTTTPTIPATHPRNNNNSTNIVMPQSLLTQAPQFPQNVTQSSPVPFTQGHQRNPSLLLPTQPSALIPSHPNITNLLSGIVLAKPKHNIPTSSVLPLNPGFVGPNKLASVEGTNTIQNEPTTSANPISGGSVGSERVVAGANDYDGGDSRCGVYTSQNGGTSWSDANALPGPFTSGDGRPLTAQGDPVVHYARNGVAFYACLAFSRSVNEGSVFVSKSINDGTTWTAPVAVRNTASTNEFNDKPWLSVDTFSDSPFRDRLYVCWTQFLGNPATSATIQFAKSSSFGSSFNAPLTLSGSSSNQGCTVDVGSDGSVYVAWIDFSTNPAQLFVRKSLNGGASFQPAVLVNSVFPIPSPLPNNNFRVNSFPDIATTRNGDVHIVWADNRNSGFGADILSGNSQDGGATWSTSTVNIADATNTDQFFPTIDAGYNNFGTSPPESGVTAPGIVQVYFYDKRYDQSASGNTLVDVTEAHSHDRGSSFILSRVTVVSSNMNTCGASFLQPFIGDYLGSSTNVNSHGVWTDCRNFPTTGQDIFTATVGPS
jgi:hypothetical protein